MKFDFSPESLKGKLNSNNFAWNLIIGCSKKNNENFP